MKKVLVTDDVHPLLMNGLESLGFTCFYQPNIINEAVHKVIGDYEGLIINSKIMVDKALLDPRSNWADPLAYDRAARKLVGMFADNFGKYVPFIDDDVKAAAIG